MFDQMDVNGDGTLDVAEMTEFACWAFKEYSSFNERPTMVWAKQRAVSIMWSFDDSIMDET